jgi:hypothetical protein
MWWISVAKSKTMRFFAVSCEFLIFLGCLWLTLVTVLPQAEAWAGGTIDSFFIVAMSFAVDAALPEAWLHVVDQYTENPKKKSQLTWSIPIAVGMLILVVANIIYTKIAGTSSSTHSGAEAIWVDILLISRMFIGISYVTIRECQSFLDRKQAKERPAPVAQNDVQTLIRQEMAGLQAALFQQLSQTVQAVSSSPAIDYQRIVNAVSSQLETRFTSAAKQGNETGGTTLSGPRLVSLPQRPATRLLKQPDLEPSTGPQEGVENQNHKATVYAMLEQHPALSVPEIVAQTGISRTTVWRHWNRWHQEHGTSGMGQIISHETSHVERGETEPWSNGAR